MKKQKRCTNCRWLELNQSGLHCCQAKDALITKKYFYLARLCAKYERNGVGLK